MPKATPHPNSSQLSPKKVHPSPLLSLSQLLLKKVPPNSSSSPLSYLKLPSQLLPKTSPISTPKSPLSTSPCSRHLHTQTPQPLLRAPTREISPSCPLQFHHPSFSTPARPHKKPSSISRASLKPASFQLHARPSSHSILPAQQQTEPLSILQIQSNFTVAHPARLFPFSPNSSLFTCQLQSLPH